MIGSVAAGRTGHVDPWRSSLGLAGRLFKTSPLATIATIEKHAGEVMMPSIRFLPTLAGALVVAWTGVAGAQDTVKFGVITDRVASAKFYAEPVSRGVELGAKVLNEKGGILGK